MRSPSNESLSCAYLVLAHTQPREVVSLAQTILAQSNTAHIVLHYDKGAGRFPALLVEDMPRVTIIGEPVRVTWGTFSQVEAIVTSLRQMRLQNIRHDWTVLISGQDFPARRIGEFEAMLQTANADAIMTYDEVTSQDRHLTDRYGFSYQRISAGPLPRLLRLGNLYDRVFNRMQPFFRVQSAPRGTFVGRRSQRSAMHLPVPVYKGCLWWALSRKAVDYLIDTLNEQPAFVEHFRNTLSADEAFFQTIIVNADRLTVRNEVLHYADWRAGNASPKFLTLADLSAVRESNQWFARKIDPTRDDGLRDALLAGIQ